MPEHGRHEVARCPVSALAVLTNARCREGLQLIHGHRHRLLMRLDDPRVVTDQRGNRNRFGRGESEIIKDAPIGRLAFLAVRPRFRPGGFLPERQPFAGLRVQIVAEPLELFRCRDAGQAQIFRALANPLASGGLPFRVVITNRQVFLEIPLGVNRNALRFG